MPPFGEGDRVQYEEITAMVLKCERDRHGWDVLILPETIAGPSGGEPFWIGADQLSLLRRA